MYSGALKSRRLPFNCFCVGGRRKGMPVSPLVSFSARMSCSGDAGKSKRLYDNTLVMSFVEHTIVLTLTGEEVRILESGQYRVEVMKRATVPNALHVKRYIFRLKKQKSQGFQLINKPFTLEMLTMDKLCK